jgi:eukaryotic-like serine/threonine-protein kinase
MSDPAPARHCPLCGAVLTPDELGGLCPVCLLGAGQGGAASDVSTTCLPPRDPGPAAFRPAALRPVPGQRFGNYEIIRLLGRGGMGEVYEAEHVEHARRVALKVLTTGLDSTEDRRRFLQEGRLAASVRHPNTVYIFGSEEIGGVPAIAMELLPGGTLKDRLERNGPLPVGEAIEVVLQVIAGLEAAQAGGILHRDIKPGNCFIDADGTVKVGDFGLSISTRSRSAGADGDIGAFKGTPEYAAPEQIRGDALDVRTDIYAVGATLYTLLTGRPPFEADRLATLFTRVLVDPPPSPKWLAEQVPKPLADVVVRCLAKDAGERPQTYDELATLLRPFGRKVLSPARLGVRFAAGVLDLFLLQIAFALIGVTIVGFRTPGLTSRMPSVAILLHLAAMVLYFSLSEWAAGASPGKRLMGLGVVDADGGTFTFARALLRAGSYVVALSVVAPFVSAVAGSFVPALEPPPPIGSPPLIPRETGVGTTLILAAMFASARRRSLNAAFHDRLSRTRVVVARSPRSATEMEEGPEQELLATARRIGPYEVRPEPQQGFPEHVLAGYDRVLRRSVWIVLHPIGSAALSPERQQVRRPGRLHWLTGGRSVEAWDAFETVEGVPFAAAAAENRGWGETRAWLRDLAVELRDGLADATLPDLDVDRLWVSATGRLMILDWPVGRAGEARHPIGRNPVPAVEEARAFLVAVAAKITPAAAPLAARSFLRELGDGRVASPVQWADRLSLLCEQPADVSPRRLAHLLVSAFLPLCAGLMALTMTLLMSRSGGPKFLALGAMGEVLLYASAAGLVSAALFRGGLAFRLMGIGIVSDAGSEAGRVRALSRAVIGWGPLLALAWVAYSRIPRSAYWDSAISGPPTLAWSTGTLLVVFALITLAGTVYAIRHPERSLQDRIAGTWLVPR